VITATALQHAKAGKEAELIALMTDLTAKVKANEPDCTTFLYVRALDKPRTYLVIEQYKDQQAFEFHHNTQYLKAFIPKMMTCLEKGPIVDVYGDVTGASHS
jgi:quinol monooxygenase YgiN